MPRVKKEKVEGIAEKLEYIGLDLENIPENFQNFEPLEFRVSRFYEDKKYRQYRYIPVKDIQILLSPTNRLDDLQEKYKNVVVPQMMKDFEYKSVMEVPHVEKVVINIGVGDAITNAKLLDEAVEELTAITGQAPVVTKAKKSIANFKLREGMPIGCKVTLRKEKMYEFLDKLFNISLPRVRDFRGVSDTSFDGRGNYTLGIKEQIIFPEIDFDKVDRTRGMDIVIVTSAKTNEEAKALLTQMGMPFKK